MTLRSIVWALVITIGLVTTAGAADLDSQMTPEQAKKVLATTQPRAEAGDAAAQYNLGVLYDRGLGVEQDYAKARSWYEKAAKQRYGRAEHNLGIMYEAGKGVDKNAAKAAHWFRRGADDGQAASQNNLGVLYMKGDGVPQNTGKAAFWTARAAAAGNGAAIDNLPHIVDDLPERHVNAKDVNVRDQPDSEARVVRQADSDSVVVVLAREPKWTQVLFPKTYETGWIANFLLADTLAPLANDEPAADKRPLTSPSTAQPKPAAEKASTAAGDAGETTEPSANDTTSAPVPEPAESASANETQDAKAKPSNVSTSQTETMHVGVGSANLRAKPNRSARVIGQLSRDAEITVLKRQNGWIRARSPGGMEGWLAGYLLVSGPH